jgi:beta-phosphoglucomutase
MEKAFIFDLNGTMIDDMQFHIKAWHYILNHTLGAKLDHEQVKGHMYGKNSELLERVFGPGRFTKEEMNEISFEKERRYQQEYRPHLRLIPGLDEFLKESYTAGVPMAIGSAAIMFNIDFVLDNLGIRHYFKAIVSADDVNTSKPDPETYLKAAEMLGVAPNKCIVFEDAPKGVESAERAGMACIALTNLHEEREFSQYSNITRFIKDYRVLSVALVAPLKSD